MERALDICIVGYGTAGQAAALFLRRQGHRVEIFERAPQLGPVGAGLLLQPTGLAALADLGLFDAALACGEPVDQLLGSNTRGRVVMDMHYQRLDPHWFGLGIQRGALFTLLQDSHTAAVRCGVTIAAVDSDTGSIRDSDGNTYGTYDLVLVTTGAASNLRPPELVRRDRAYPWGAIWCLCDDPSREFSRQLLQRYDKARRMAGILPVGRLPGDSAQTRKLSFFWSLPRCELSGILERGLDAWRAEVVAYWPQTETLLSTLTHVGQLAAANYRDAVLRRFYQGRVAYLGDAAHAMSPQLGQGANMALLDAQAIAEALAREADVPQALRAFDRERRRHVRIYQLLSRWLTPIFQSELDWAASLRDALMGPVGRAPIARGEMLKVLAGIKRGFFGSLPRRPLPKRTNTPT
ncbi:MAG: NAD(P)/FAD-dependent oxidoreductase [Tahibacter sp.]